MKAAPVVVACIKWTFSLKQNQALIKTSFSILFKSCMHTQNTDGDRTGPECEIARLLIKKRITSECMCGANISGCVSKWWMTRGIGCIPALLYNQPKPLSIWAATSSVREKPFSVLWCMVLKVIPCFITNQDVVLLVYCTPGQILTCYFIKKKLIQLWAQSGNDFLNTYLNQVFFN